MKNTSSELTERAAEVRMLISENELNLAGRRLLDFVTDFETSADIRNEAVLLRAKHNRLAQKELADREDEEEKLLPVFLELLDRAEKAAQAAKSTETPAEYFEGSVSSEKAAFRGKSVGKTYSSVGFRLSNVDLELKLGELTGIVGENGNGKTTLLRIVAGDLAIDSGHISYPSIEKPDADLYYLRRHIAFIPQNLKSWRGKLKDNLHFEAANHGIFGKENEEIVDFVIHRLGLSRYRNAGWGDISSGYKLRFELARALVWRPKLLVLDEPLANLDINAKLLFMQDLRLLAASSRYPVAVLMSSQQLHEIESVVDNIMFLKDGKVMYNGPVAEIGQGSEVHTFELGGDFRRTDLHDLLREIEGLRIEDTGQSFIVEVPADIAADKILALIAPHHRLDYFRDISRSTRKLFNL